MSEDWFDKTYRSDETSPADLDARILKQARRATRRWVVALLAGAAFTIAIALVLAIMLTNIELDVPPTERRPARDTQPATANEAAAGEAGAQQNCARSMLLVGPLGGPGRRDRAEICLTGDLLRAEFLWDGESSCPSRLEAEVPADAPVILEQGDLVIGSAGYRCVGGEWTPIAERDSECQRGARRE